MQTQNYDLFNQPTFDVSRGRGNEVSKEMNALIQPHKENDRNIILNLINGKLSTNDISKILKKPINKISGRFTELKAKNLIQKKGVKKSGNSTFTVYEKVNM
jgi:predicted transcriptional regulator